jgi:hypothetical protein
VQERSYRCDDKPADDMIITLAPTPYCEPVDEARQIGTSTMFTNR